MSITVRLAHEADNRKILELVDRVYQNGLVRLGFQRQPDFFIGARIVGDEQVIAVADDAEHPDRLAGLTVISSRDLFISGKKRRVHYSGDTRVDFPYRRRGIASQLFMEQRKHRTTDDLMHGIVLAGNTAPLEAAKRVEDGVLFDFWVSHTIETSFIYTRKVTPRIPAGATIRAATPDDVPAMQAFFDAEAPRRNGYPVYDFAALLAGDPYYTGIRIDDYALAFKGGRLAGMLGVWDQKGFKQTRVLGYKGWVNALRPLYNGYAAMFGGMKLPAAGGSLNYTALHTPLVKDDDKALFQALIDWQMARDGGRHDALATAWTQGDPLAEVPRRYKRQKLLSNHFWLSYGDDPRPGIDERPLYVELARL